MSHLGDLPGRELPFNNIIGSTLGQSISLRVRQEELSRRDNVERDRVGNAIGSIGVTSRERDLFVPGFQGKLYDKGLRTLLNPALSAESKNKNGGSRVESGGSVASTDRDWEAWKKKAKFQMTCIHHGLKKTITLSEKTSLSANAKLAAPIDPENDEKGNSGRAGKRSFISLNISRKRDIREGV